MPLGGDAESRASMGGAAGAGGPGRVGGDEPSGQSRALRGLAASETGAPLWASQLREPKKSPSFADVALTQLFGPCRPKRCPE